MGQVLTICLGMVKHTQRDRRRSVTLHDGESFNISFVMLKDEVKESSFRLIKLYFALMTFPGNLCQTGPIRCNGKQRR